MDWWDADSDSDFQIDDTSDDSDTECAGLRTAMFICGPTGVGKTAMVYACAEELGYKVLFALISYSLRAGTRVPVPIYCERCLNLYRIRIYFVFL